MDGGLDAIHVRHDDIADDKIGLEGARALHRSGAAVDRRSLVPVQVQYFGQSIGDHLLVIYHHDSRFSSHMHRTLLHTSEAELPIIAESYGPEDSAARWSSLTCDMTEAYVQDAEITRRMAGTARGSTVYGGFRLFTNQLAIAMPRHAGMSRGAPRAMCPRSQQHSDRNHRLDGHRLCT